VENSLNAQTLVADMCAVTGSVLPDAEVAITDNGGGGTRRICSLGISIYSMKFNPAALLVLVGFGLLVAMAASFNGGAWSHGAEAVATVVILLGVSGFLTRSRRTR
jgi:hypothetical protein